MYSSDPSIATVNARMSKVVHIMSSKPFILFTVKDLNRECHFTNRGIHQTLVDLRSRGLINFHRMGRMFYYWYTPNLDEIYGKIVFDLNNSVLDNKSRAVVVKFLDKYLKVKL